MLRMSVSVIRYTLLPVSGDSPLRAWSRRWALTRTSIASLFVSAMVAELAVPALVVATLLPLAKPVAVTTIA
jgi:hypothetical protein